MRNNKKELNINHKSSWEYVVDEQDTIDNFRNIGYDTNMQAISSTLPKRCWDLKFINV